MSTNMKKTIIFVAVAAMLMLAFTACKPQEKKILRYSIADTIQPTGELPLCEFVWDGDMLKQVHKSNPYSGDRPQYEDWAAFFNYTTDYVYEDEQLKSITGNKYRSSFTYEGDKLVRIDQFSKEDGVHAYRVDFSYGDSNKVNATYYSMTKEALHWLECSLYPRNDSTGTRIQPEMPADTTLHVSAEAVYQWENGNLVYTQCSLTDSYSMESRMEYDNKINPLFNTHTDFDKIELLVLTLSTSPNDLGVSKNNVTKTTISMSQGDEANTQNKIVLEYSYEYDGEYPTAQTELRTSSKRLYTYAQ